MKPPKKKTKSEPPFPFVLDRLADVVTLVRPMFGCWALYAEEKIVLILAEKAGFGDNGVWLATVPAHHASLKRLFPSMRSIEAFGPGETGWQCLPSDADDFEEAALRACGLIARKDERIGKVPKPRTKKRLVKRAPEQKTKAIRKKKNTSPGGILSPLERSDVRAHESPKE